MMFFSHRISFRNVCAAFCAPTCNKYSYTYKANFSLACASEGALEPFPLAYMPGPSSVMDGRGIILSRRPFSKKHHQLYSALPLIWCNMPPLRRNSVLQQSLRLVCLYGFTGYVLSRSFCQRHIMLHLLFDFLIYYDIIQGCCLQLTVYDTFFIPFYRYSEGNAREKFIYLHGY